MHATIAKIPAAPHPTASLPAPPAARPAGAAIGRLPLEVLLTADRAALPSALDLPRAVLAAGHRPRPPAPAVAPFVVPFDDAAVERRERQRRIALSAAAWGVSAVVAGASIAAALG